MKEFEGNKISIGDRVKVLWNYDSRIHIGKIIGIKNNVITIQSNEDPMRGSIFPSKMTISDYSRITNWSN